MHNVAKTCARVFSNNIVPRKVLNSSEFLAKNIESKGSNSVFIEYFTKFKINGF
jgi:hypothetical protein